MSDPAARSSRPSPPPRAWPLCLLGLLIVACLYAPTLGAPLVWDDLVLITDSQTIHSLSAREAFLEPFWQSTAGVQGTAAYYRPLTKLSFALDYAVHGENPAGYHLTNVILHLLTAVLVFALLRRRQASIALAWVLMLLWALLPRLTEGAAWVSGRTDVLAAVFVLAALLAHHPAQPRRLAAAALFALCALFCKETGIAAFLGLAVLELNGRSESGAAATTGARRFTPSWWRSLVVLAVPLALYAGLRVAAGTRVSGNAVELPLAVHAQSVCEALGRYAYMLANPFQPRSYLGQVGQPELSFVALGALLLALLALLALLPRARPTSLETLALVAVALLPLLLVLHLIRLPVSYVAADRYLYLPSAALLLAAAPAIARLAASTRWLMPGVLALTLACGARTALRVADYGSPGRFWVAAIEGAPREPGAFAGLGGVLYRAGLLREALGIFQQALRLPGNSQLALDNAALISGMLGQRELAAALGDRLLQQAPNVASYRLRRAAIAFNALDLDLARRQAMRAMELDPSMPEPRVLLAHLYKAHQLMPSIKAGMASPATVMLLDMDAMRYPELAAGMRRELELQTVDDATLRVALGFMLARGEPSEGQELLKRYAARHPAHSVAQLSALVASRLEQAAELRSQLAQLPSTVTGNAR